MRFHTARQQLGRHLRRLPQYWRRRPLPWILLAICLPVSSVMAAYAIADPAPTPPYRAEKVVA